MYGFGNRAYKPTGAGGSLAVRRTALQQKAYDQQMAYNAKRRQLGVAGYRAGMAATRNRLLMTPETKYFDTSIDTLVTTAGTDWADTEVPCDFYVNSSGTPAVYTDCALIPSAIGSAYGQVDGLKYKIKKLRVRGTLSITNTTSQATTTSGILTRLLLIMDTQPNGTQAQGEDIMQDIGIYASNAHSFQRVANTGGRFRILKDKWFKCDSATSANNTTAGTISTAYNISRFSYQWVPKIPVEVNVKAGNATPTIAGLSNINIFLLAYAYNPGGGGVQTVNIGAASRCYYVD